MENGLHVRGGTVPESAYRGIHCKAIDILKLQPFRSVRVRALSEFVLLRSSAQGGSRGELPNTQPQKTRIFSSAIPDLCPSSVFDTRPARCFGVLLPLYL